MPVWLLFTKAHDGDVFSLVGVYDNPLKAEVGAGLRKAIAWDILLVGAHEIGVEESLFAEHLVAVREYDRCAAAGFEALNRHLERGGSATGMLPQLDQALKLRVNPDAVQCAKCGYVYRPSASRTIVLPGGRLKSAGECLCARP